MATLGFMGLHLASCGVRAFFVIWQRAVMSSHHGCPADGLLCREMSREQPLSLLLSLSAFFSLSLNLARSLGPLPFSCPGASVSLLWAVTVGALWEVSWSSQPQMQEPISGLCYRKICLFTLCRVHTLALMRKCHGWIFWWKNIYLVVLPRTCQRSFHSSVWVQSPV